MHRLKPYLVLSILIITCLLVACSPDTSTVSPQNTLEITGGSSFGQSFTAEYAGMNRISVILIPMDSFGSGALIFHLRNSPRDTQDLAEYKIPYGDIQQQNYYTIPFPTQPDSQMKDYYLQADVEGAGSIQISIAPADSYINGALYVGGVPQESQLVFQVNYDQGALIKGIASRIITWVGVLLVGLFIFVIPGWGLLSWLWPGWGELSWASKSGLSAGLSLAIYPVFILWTSLLGLHLGAVYAWLPPIIGILLLAWNNRSLVLRDTDNPVQVKFRSKFRDFFGSLGFADAALIIVLGFIIISRFWAIRSIDIPLFGDSFQHTMITQLIIDHGGLFNSWAPYADLTSFTYHFGYHSVAAVFHWISGASAARAVLWSGQIINILAILALYPFTLKITKNRWAGVIAMLVGGLLSPMPMTYLQWGRYTQLAGQVILLPAIWFCWSILEKSGIEEIGSPVKRKWLYWYQQPGALGSLVVSWIGLGGLALTHYRVLILAILFFPAYLIFSTSWKSFILRLVKITWIGIGSAILFLPWFIHLFGGRILAMYSSLLVKLPAATSATVEMINKIGPLSNYLPYVIWLLYFLCLGAGLWNRNRGLAILNFWWLLIVLATNPDWIELPGAGAITNFAVLIAFYIPASISLGYAAEWVTRSARDHLFIEIKEKLPVIIKSLSVVAVILIALLSIWGFENRISEMQLPAFTLVTRPDLRAAEWIKANTPQDAHFLINSFTTSGNTAYVGSDAGWWLPLLAGRQVTVPPLNYAAEAGTASDYLQQVNTFNKNIKSKGVTSPSGYELLKANGIGYIFIGQRHGHVNYSGKDVLDPEMLNKDQHYQLVYHQDRVWVYKVIY